MADGKTDQQITAYYIAKYGSEEPLASPIDRGFNRLAWFVPYLIGAGGLVLVGSAAVKWSRRRGATTPGEAGAAASELQQADPELSARLDDELRNLD